MQGDPCQPGKVLRMGHGTCVRSQTPSEGTQVALLGEADDPERPRSHPLLSFPTGAVGGGGGPSGSPSTEPGQDACSR